MKTATEVIKAFEGAVFKARHGDVVVIRCDSPGELGEDAKGVVAAGEATGHFHKVSRAKVNSVINDMLQRVVVVNQSVAKLTHQEHKTIALPRGEYRTGIQRQYSPLGWSRVID